MSNAIGDLPGRSPARAVRRELTYLRCSFPVGATGAVGTITKDDPAWGVTRTDTGDYTLAFPKGAYGELSVKAVAAASVNSHPEIVTFSPSTGAATITFVAAGGTSPTDPDENAVVYISVWLDEGP